MRPRSRRQGLGWATRQPFPPSATVTTVATQIEGLKGNGERAICVTDSLIALARNTLQYCIDAA